MESDRGEEGGNGNKNTQLQVITMEKYFTCAFIVLNAFNLLKNVQLTNRKAVSPVCLASIRARLLCRTQHSSSQIIVPSSSQLPLEMFPGGHNLDSTQARDKASTKLFSNLYFMSCLAARHTNLLSQPKTCSSLPSLTKWNT